jgi:hypothetical protein
MISIGYQTAAVGLLISGLAACEAGGARETAATGHDANRGSAVQVGRAPAPASDTAVSDETRRAMESFRATVNGALPDRLAGAAPSMDELVARFIDAVERADTAALIAMTMNRGEFIALHYPRSIYVRPPYELLPEDVWFLSRAQTEKGLTRLLRRYGGQPFGFVRYDCPPPVRREGPDLWWSGCTITRASGEEEHTMRWFGPIWERDGVFKFGGYANDL